MNNTTTRSNDHRRALAPSIRWSQVASLLIAVCLAAQAGILEPGGFALAAGSRQFSPGSSIRRQIATPSGGMPLPLRELYCRSELIVVGQAVDEEVVERQQDQVLLKTTLRITSTLKGDYGGAVIQVYHFAYNEAQSQLFRGIHQIAFLNKRGSSEGVSGGEGYELAHYMMSTRSTNPDGGHVLERVKELNLLENQSRVRANDIAEWLVRCVEQQVTKWEGSYELAAGIRRDRYRFWLALTAQVKPAEDGAGTTEGVSARDSTVAPQLTQNAHCRLSDDLDFASLLNTDQRERLIRVLFASTGEEVGDFELVELGRKWKDPRLAGFLIARLRAMQISPRTYSAKFVEVVSEMLGGDEVERLADFYTKNVVYHDLESGRSEAERDAALGTRSAMLVLFLAAVDAELHDSGSGVWMKK